MDSRPDRYTEIDPCTFAVDPAHFEKIYRTEVVPDRNPGEIVPGAS
jgi:hypothetical protein